MCDIARSMKGCKQNGGGDDRYDISKVRVSTRSMQPRNNDSSRIGPRNNPRTKKVLCSNGCHHVAASSGVDIFRETFDPVPSLRKARAALEDDFGAARSSDDAKGLGNVVGFLDDRRTDLTLTEMFAGSQDRLLEIRMRKQLQANASPWLTKQRRWAALGAS